MPSGCTITVAVIPAERVIFRRYLVDLDVHRDALRKAYPGVDAGAFRVFVAFSKAFVEGIDPADFAIPHEIAFDLCGRRVTFTSQSYLLTVALPNFFHITTAYDILGHDGLQIGKLDYLGSM